MACTTITAKFVGHRILLWIRSTRWDSLPGYLSPAGVRGVHLRSSSTIVNITPGSIGIADALYAGSHDLAGDGADEA